MAGFRNVMSRILLGLAFTALAALGPAAAKDAILTQDSVSRFLASFGEMRTIAISEGLTSKLKTEAEKIAVGHGFTDLKDWAGTGRSIAQAYLFITVGPARGIARDTLEQNKDAAISQLEKLGLLNDKSKQKLKENLDSLEDQLSREPPPENVAVVKKMKPDIDGAVKFGLN